MSKRGWWSSVIVWRLAIGVLVHPLRRGERGIGGRLGLLLRRKGLAVSAVEHHAISRITPSASGTRLVLSVSQVRISGVCWHKRLRLRRDGSEHALLVEADAVRAASILGVFESRASDLQGKTTS